MMRLRCCVVSLCAFSLILAAGFSAADPSLVAQINVGQDAADVAINTTTQQAYVPNAMSNTISVIDLASRSIVRTISDPDGPNAIAIQQSTGRVYVTDSGKKTLFIVDGNTTQFIDLTPYVGSATGLSGVAVDQNSDSLYVGAYRPSTILKINATTGAVLGSANIQNDLYSIIFGPSGTLYVEAGYTSIDVIDSQSLRMLRSITLPADGILNADVYDPVQNRLYVGEEGKLIFVIDGTTNSLISTYTADTVAWRGLAFDSSTQRLYAVANYYQSRLYAFDDRGSVLWHVDLDRYGGGNPGAAAIDLARNEVLTVNSGYSNYNSIVNVVGLNLGADTIAPHTYIDSFPPARQNKSSVTFSFSATDNVTFNASDFKFECRFDSNAFSSCSSPLTFSAPDGDHVFNVRAVDQAGNIDPNPPGYAFTIDTTPPTSNPDVSPVIITPAFLTGTAGDATSGVASTTVRLENVSTHQVTYEATVCTSGCVDGKNEKWQASAIPNRGIYLVSSQSVDRVGNVSRYSASGTALIAPI